MTLTTKFKKDLQMLRSASDGDIFLDVKNPKLYKKVRRYYENEGVVFSGDPLDDYDILMDCLVRDFESIEVAQSREDFKNALVGMVLGPLGFLVPKTKWWSHYDPLVSLFLKQGGADGVNPAWDLVITQSKK